MVGYWSEDTGSSHFSRQSWSFGETDATSALWPSTACVVSRANLCHVTLFTCAQGPAWTRTHCVYGEKLRHERCQSACTLMARDVILKKKDKLKDNVLWLIYSFSCSPLHNRKDFHGVHKDRVEEYIPLMWTMRIISSALLSPPDCADVPCKTDAWCDFSCFLV